MKGIKLSLVFLCVLVFLFACVPNAMGCNMDIKPGSYPNSINVDNNGVVTMALQDEDCSPDTVNLYLYRGDEELSSLFNAIPNRYEYVNYLDINPYLTGSIYKGPGYLVKFSTEDLSELFAGHVGEENLYLRIQFPGFDSRDSVRLLSNNK